MARTITGGDHLDCSIGGLVGTPAGANTLAAIFRRNSDSTWDTIISLETSANASKLSMQISDTNNLSYVSAAADRSTNISFTNSDGWCLLVVTKAGATATPRGHKYVYSSNTWTHTDASSTVGGDSSDLTGGRVQFGRWGTGDPVDGDYLLAGVWKRQLGDTEIETLAFSLQAWYASAPNGLWLLDQSATTQNVIDSTGNGANQSAITGTSIATSSPLVFSYGFGAAVPSFVAGGGTDATATPAAIANVVALPAATISAGSTPTPAAIANVAAVPAATISAGSTVTPAAITATVALPAATISAGATVTPATIAATVALPAPTIQTSGNATITPSVINAVAALPAATVSAGSTVGPAAIATTAALPAATVSAGSTVTPGAIAAVVSLPAPTVDTAGNATVTPAAIANVVSLQSLTISAGSTATPATVAALVSVPRPGTGATVKATSTATVTAGHASTAAVAANRTSTPGVT